MLSPTSTFVTNDFFSLAISHRQESTCIKMCMIFPLLNTSSIPSVCGLLHTYLPSIYTSKCFNEQKLAFIKEVEKTEIGHLFEHILLEYIYTLKIARGHKNIIVKGETAWNWEKDPEGVFHITLNIGEHERMIFYEALTPSLELLQVILQSTRPNNLGAKLLMKKTLPLIRVKKELLS